MCGNAILNLGEITAVNLVGLRQENRLARLGREELEYPLAMVRIETAEGCIDDQRHRAPRRIGHCRNQCHREDLAFTGRQIEVVDDASMAIDK